MVFILNTLWYHGGFSTPFHNFSFLSRQSKEKKKAKCDAWLNESRPREERGALTCQSDIPHHPASIYEEDKQTNVPGKTTAPHADRRCEDSAGIFLGVWTVRACVWVRVRVCVSLIPGGGGPLFGGTTVRERARRGHSSPLIGLFVPVGRKERESEIKREG